MQKGFSLVSPKKFTSKLSILLMCFFLGISSLCLPSSVMAQVDIGPLKELFKADGIEVRGNKKVEKEAILEKISAKKGTSIDNFTVKRDIENIYGLKFFDYVEAHKELKNGKYYLVYVVKERPIIAKIIFEGNSGLDDDDLKEQVKSKEFSILDINSLKTDVAAIKKKYEEKGYFLANVDFETRKVGKENIEVVFKIKEFEKVRVKKVTFLGNTAFSDDQLKDIMETREESLFSFMSNSGNFKEFNFSTDMERIKFFYQTKGYLQVNLGAPEITVSEDKKWVFITLKINEGPRFSVNAIKFDGEMLFTEKELKEKIGLKEGEFYSERTLRQDIQLMTEMYQDKGHAFANVLRTLDVVPGENKVNVQYSFEKGKIAYFGKITVKGNTKTRDKVIRRELRIEEGKKYSGTALRRSRENVNRLGFFEPKSVIFNTVARSGRDDLLDVEIIVKERNTGQISVGAGYSSATKAFFQGSISQNNFLGKGQSLDFKINWASRKRDFLLSFTDPYFKDTKWTAGGDLWYTRDKESRAYKTKRIGGSLRIGYPVFDYTRLFFSYKIEDTFLDDILDKNVDEKLEEGVASSVKATLIRDTRDNKFEPRKGYYLSVSSEVAGLGGSKKWWRNELDARYYKNFIGDFVFRSRFVAKRIDSALGGSEAQIPRTEKYTLGGPRNLRGYTFDDIGPEVPDKNNPNLMFNVGGQFASFVTIEIEHPLAREAGLKWVVFFDAGHAGDFDDMKIREDWGFGFRWFSPIGVLRFEIGFPLDPEEGQGQEFHFDIGQLF